MTTAATSLLGLALPVTGELSGVWGQTVNDSITTLLDSAVAGTTTLSTDADVTLTTTTLASNQARQAILLCSGARTALRTITAPAQSKIYTIINATTGGFSVKLVGVGPTTGLTIPNGASAVVAWNGSDFIEIGSSTIGNLTVNGNLTVTGTTTLTGAATLTANPTLSAGTANGVAYLNGSKVVTTGTALTFDGTILNASTGTPIIRATASTVGSLYGFELNGGALDAFVKAQPNTSELRIGSGRSAGWGGFTTFYIDTAEQMRLTSTGLGIGTSSPVAKLDVLKTPSDTISRTNAAGGFGDWASLGAGLLLQQTLSSPYGFALQAANAANSVQFPLLLNPSGGNVGIGTSSPSQLLQARKDQAAYTWMRVDNQTNSASAYAGLAIGANGNTWGITVGSSAANSNALNFVLDATGTNASKMTLDSSGNLGLGVTPSAWNASHPALQFKYNTAISSYSSNDGLELTSNGYADTATTWKYIESYSAAQYVVGGGQHAWKIAALGTAGNAITFTQAMTLDASGNLGLGTTSPTVNLHVYNASSAEIRTASANIGLQLYSSEGAGTSVIGTYTNHALVFRTNATERARIDSSGNFLVGTAAIATNATDGFLYIPTCAGTPTGTPTTKTGLAPMVIDSTNNKMYIYSGGAWRALN